MADYAEEAFFTRIVDTFTGCDAFAGCQVYRLTLDPCKESDQLLIVCRAGHSLKGNMWADQPSVF
jgi:hypothetical protein